MIYHYQPSAQSEKACQLFNLSADPFEHKNLAAAEPLELRPLMRGLIDALEKHQAVYPEAKDGKTALKPRLP